MSITTRHQPTEFALEPLSAKEIQARVRAGASAEIVAAETGWPLDKVQRYAGPPLAEREYVAGRAQLVEVRRTGSSVTLGETVAQALSADAAADISWDAARRADGKWVVLVYFTSRGDTQYASWTYDNVGRTVHPVDETARRLMGVSDDQIFDYITDDRAPAIKAEVEVEVEIDRPRLVAVPDAPPAEIFAVEEHAHVLDVLIPIPELTEKPQDRPAAKPAPKPKVKGKRASVPSWDEILFGATRGDDV
ncbi:MAG: DUF3071 domain-containing protein [Actinobacteria bacterium]|nr:DUF3071 domain-containing protein [Actinomycetota bacterium]